MKSRYSTIDLIAAVAELQSVLHMRLINVYDVDHKTYLFKLAKQEEKAVLLIESGNRIHRTEFEWPKNPAPSGFTMKLRKHILNRRLEQVAQLGIDRIVDLQFGSNEAAYHVILELYDKGNIILTDYEYTILNILRPRTESELVRFVVHEKYPVDHARQVEQPTSLEDIHGILLNAKEGDSLKKVLNPHFQFGPALIDHALLSANFVDGVKLGKGFKISEDMPRLVKALGEAENILNMARQGKFKGFIIQKEEKRAKPKDAKGAPPPQDNYLVYSEFHPCLFHQHEKGCYVEFPSFNKAVDDFFSKLESQKLDLKAIQQEKEALKKLENVKKDHEMRLGMLKKAQEVDKRKAWLIEVNLDLVQKAIAVVQSAIANQLDWRDISELIQEAKQQGDPVAGAIKSLKLEVNNITMLLSNPFGTEEESDSDDDSEKVDKGDHKPVLVDIDLDLTAYANAKKYYDKKRHAGKKEQKTIESSTKAYKSAEKKTKQALKDVAVVTSINKARRTHWFEKFLWFISSENYLVMGGHDQQQNELIVKRYLRPGDIYVHADLHGASSIVIKNPYGPGVPIPPKTLNEAGTLAVCSSAAWESKVVTSAWWVYHDQVSKTAPTGEYLTTGSFMVRGKKNYLPPCYLVMGFGFLFRLDEESIPNHKDERKPKPIGLDQASEADSEDPSQLVESDEEIVCDNTQSDEEDEEKPHAESNKVDNPLSPVAEDEKELSDEELAELSNENEAKANDTDESSDSETTHFPDTTINLEHIGGDQFLMKPSHLSTSDTTDEVVVYLGDEQPVVIKPSTIKKTMDKSKLGIQQNRGQKQVHIESKDEEAETTADGSQSQVNAQKKRGHKYKLKKMKEKYKDQDEDDRKLAMSILQPSGQKESKKSKKVGKNTQASCKNAMKKSNAKPQVLVTQTNATLPANTDGTLKGETGTKGDAEEAHNSDEEKEAKQQADEDAKLFDSLTGIPTVEDVLLYALPVCAPYNAIVNYKYKVKITPGTGRRGKAAKTALSMFQHDKTTSGREKDLFKSVKDQDISRNLPGKVKMSVPQSLRKDKKKWQKK